MAHVYVREPRDARGGEGAARATCRASTRCSTARSRRPAGSITNAAGELVAVADADAWFTYYYWLDDARAPDYARTVDIHRKPGYDPAELFLDPALTLPKLRVAATLARKALGFRYLMNVIPLDATLVRGSHGRIPASLADGPVPISVGTGALSRAARADRSPRPDPRAPVRRRDREPG